jgi:hypothetical protein
MRVLILGTSNSILKDGWVAFGGRTSKLREEAPHLPETPILAVLSRCELE